MHCNYGCRGCYSRARPAEEELSTADLDKLLTEAETLGVAAVVVTGGEPLLRDDLIRLIAGHKQLLFVVITNGSLVTPGIARHLSRCGNTITLVSIDGFPGDTDRRRGRGAYDTAIHAFGCLRGADACFGFAATNTASNSAHLGSDEFVDRMITLGCAVGFFSEYVPCGPDPRPEWVLDESSRSAFRERVLELRRRKAILLSQFPHDEYGPENRCAGAGRLSLHINSQGDVEPCPFMPVSAENIRDGGLIAACESPFLSAIRRQPNLLRREQSACSLFEHRGELEVIAERLGAHWNERRA
jgi:MoaA/NifB/PqqE/SkfB family radical SAM enzyme